MKTQITKYLLILIAIAIVLSAAGCDFFAPSGPPQTTAPPVRTPPPPPPSPPPSPSPSPEPQEQQPLMLEFEECYHMFGDPIYPGLIFREDGFVTTSDGFELEYEAEGTMISFLQDGAFEPILRIIDEFTLEEVATGIRYVREGGDEFGSLFEFPVGVRVFFTGEYYFLDGEADEASLYFKDDGTADFFDLEDDLQATYVIDGSEITVTVEDGEIIVLKLLDPVTLEDAETGEKYGLSGAFSRELELFEGYYQFGDNEELSLFFRDENEVDFVDLGIVVATGEYTVEEEEHTISIDLYGEEILLSIVNSYILYFVGQDINFIRMP